MLISNGKRARALVVRSHTQGCKSHGCTVVRLKAGKVERMDESKAAIKMPWDKFDVQDEELPRLPIRAAILST
jgi:hypothetical protein